MTFESNSVNSQICGPGTLRARRCAIYCRVSTDESLGMEFNSIDAQREAGEAYIASQLAAGWTCAAVYEDPGFTGATLRRPALTRLLRDVQRNLIDIVVVHKIDRLTRSLRDFSQIIALLESLDVSIVSVTQQFNTTSSMGRLTLNMMLSFAQFEREICSERIRDKIDASKKKGLWMGGLPPLGYCCVDRKLAIVPAEASVVREIFSLWIATGSAALVAKHLLDQGIRTKRHVTARGRVLGDKPYTMKCIHRVLCDQTYLGLIKHKGKVYPGRHPAIIERETWDQAKAKVGPGRNPISEATNSLLAGLLYSPDGEPFYYTYTDRRERRYGYYVSRSQARYGARRKTSRRVAAASVEQAVTEQICRKLVSTGFVTGLAKRLGASANPLRSAVTTPQLVAVLQQARALWEHLDAEERHRLAKALIVRVELGAGATPYSVQITWKANPFSFTDKE